METEASINHLIVNADFDSTFVLNNSLSYSGSVTVPFDKVLPLEEQHNLYLKKYGKHVSAGITGVFAFSNHEYQFTEAQSNFRPGEEDYGYYIKSRTIFDNHSVFKYGGSINAGLNWSKKTLLLLAGGSAIQNSGYTITHDHEYFNDNLQLNIIDFDKNDISYSLHCGVLLSGELFVHLNNYLYSIAAKADYAKTNTPIHESSSKLQRANSTITIQGLNARTHSLNAYFSIYHSDETDFAHSNGSNSKRPFSVTVNSLRLQLYSFSGITTDYSLNSAVNPTVTESTHIREQYQTSGSIVPQITIFENFKLQFNTGVAADLFYSIRVTSLFTACIMSLSIPFKNGLLVTTTINSGDFRLRIPADDQKTIADPIYQAYSSSIALQVRMRSN